MQKLINSVQHYAWGSKTALTSLYGIANPTQQPMAELWMGAHPKSSSQVMVEGQPRALRDLIDTDKAGLLGESVARRFGELPFLFKVLCADQPLSIQVHPSKTAAEAGYARENAAGIPLDAATRNYKDANHKPELVYALTPFKAINGFRPLSEIVSLLQPLAGAHQAIAHFLNHPDTASLSALFAALLSLAGEEKSLALDILQTTVASQHGEPWQTIADIANVYPDDSGLFAPLLLNVITLQPAEAMFLFAETPHAYLHGVALEVMANSDNVLRAGLTPKYIDIPELLANLRFDSRPADTLLTTPQQEGASQHFPIPVEDFSFSIHALDSQPLTVSQQSAAIIFCIDGQATLNCGGQALLLQAGESAFISAREPSLTLSGKGRVARVFNELPNCG